ncbi:YwmB family TATA-box binding protein [Mahella sp.]|jgi:hypothetical protein|uniref:YwmB family TATA-box binding protein n=1 Tax=Mahella sp. TaxID=2798721 RepID=UPI0025BDB880|nr:YwmB family TATA-box binding protein [Mahella sp.]MBZ4665428.1 hypothetical protein [Mahella sp.]MDK2903772.1 hypothetical protein [Clostridiales bacterium]
MRNIIFAAIALLMTLIMAGYAPVNTSWADDVAQTQRAFMNMDIMPEVYSINAWINVNNKGRGDTNLKELGNDVAMAVGIMKTPYRYNAADDGAQHWINIYSGNVSVSVKMPNGADDAQTYITVNASGDIQNAELEDIVESIEKGLKQYSEDIHMSLALKGHIKGEARQQTLDRLNGVAFETLNAQYVEGIKSEKLSSTTAYSPSIKHYVDIKGRKANMQLAARYNSYDDRTDVWLGMPLITVEY